MDMDKFYKVLKKKSIAEAHLFVRTIAAQIPREMNCAPCILAGLRKDFLIGLKLFHVF